MYASYSQLGSKPNPNQDQYNVLEIAHDPHKQQIIKENRIAVVDIYADWCGPCKQTAPSYAVVAKQYSKPGFCAVVKQKYDVLNDDEKEEIQGIPVFQFFRDGQLVDKVIGADIPQVENKLKQLLDDLERKMENNTGPTANRNSIRQNNRGSLPNPDYTTSGSPYTPPNTYHQYK